MAFVKSPCPPQLLHPHYRWVQIGAVLQFAPAAPDGCNCGLHSGGEKKALPVCTSHFYCPVADAIGYENYYSREPNRSNSSPTQSCGMMKRWVANFGSQNRYFSIWMAMYDSIQNLESYYFLHCSKRQLRINKYKLDRRIKPIKTRVRVILPWPSGKRDRGQVHKTISWPAMDSIHLFPLS